MKYIFGTFFIVLAIISFTILFIESGPMLLLFFPLMPSIFFPIAIYITIGIYLLKVATKKEDEHFSVPFILGGLLTLLINIITMTTSNLWLGLHGIDYRVVDNLGFWIPTLVLVSILILLITKKLRAKQNIGRSTLV